MAEIKKTESKHWQSYGMIGISTYYYWEYKYEHFGKQFGSIY